MRIVRRSFSPIIPVLGSLVCLVIFGTTAVTTLASSLSGTVPTKAAIYQGVVVIAPTTTAVLELGNAGRDLAGSSDLYLRPNGLAEAQGARFVSNGGVTDLYVTSLCLYGSGSEVCQNGVPSGGSDTFWKSTLLSGSYETLSPSVASRGVQLGTVSAPVLGRAFEIRTNNVAPSVAITGNMTTGTYDINDALVGSGAVSISGRLQVTRPGFILGDEPVRVNYDRVTNNYALPWSQAYQGIGTGLDADMLDGGTTVNFSTATKKDLFWKDIISGANSYKALCVHTDAPSLCSTSTGAFAGKICSTDADCGGIVGGCTRLCQSKNETCAAGTSVNDSHTIAATSCANVGDGGCNAYCASSNTSVIVCNGSTPPPGASCTGTVGTIVRSTAGSFVSCSVIVGFNAIITCSCRVTTNTPYLKNMGYGSGDLCTDILK